jgi:DNA-binding CsgD family transcriptional regulator
VVVLIQALLDRHAMLRLRVDQGEDEAGVPGWSLQYVLPRQVQDWLHQCAAGRTSSMSPSIDLNASGLTPKLQLLYVGQVGPDENLLRLVESNLGSDQTVLKQKLLVTEREAEVLLWIARGKSNRDIAEILNLSPRTVNKHLEQIYAKLGVENRTSAAALAVRTLGVG